MRKYLKHFYGRTHHERTSAELTFFPLQIVIRHVHSESGFRLESISLHDPGQKALVILNELLIRDV